TLAPGTGTATPRSFVSDIPLSDEQRSLSLKVSLADLTARASGHYAQKRFEEAAEIYAQAAEMQAEMNGEMAVENAEILFLYGRSLFKVGQEKSDVLGGKAPAEGARVQKADSEDKTETPEADRVAQEATKIIADETSGAKTESKELEGKKPLFQFTGDENWDDSDEEDGAEGEDGEGEDEEEDEDDLASAFEILDLARVLFKKQLDAKLAAVEAGEGKGKGKEVANGGGDNSDAGIRHIKERLADTYDRLAEISLENERYPNAIADMREALRYNQELLPEDSELIAEAHFKLSLALEFASITSQQNDDGSEGPKEINQEMRDEAAKELEAAIASTKLKLQNKEVELATLHSPEDNEITRSQIADVKDMIADLEQRLVDLRGPPIDVQSALGLGPVGGILGAALGESAVETEARIEEAKKTATDLTGLVRKKGKPVPAPSSDSADGNKRKAEEDLPMEDEASKKPRTE
ncbi:hypothetical protein M406DRAFT_219096, partial [Cryphonectria parasitica EP155]